MPDISMFDLLPLVQQSMKPQVPAAQPAPVEEKPFDPLASGKFADFLMNANVPENLSSQRYPGEDNQLAGTLFSQGGPQDERSLQSIPVAGAADLGVSSAPNVSEADQGAIQAIINAFRQKQLVDDSAMRNTAPEGGVPAPELRTFKR